ncbi:MAG: DUF1501 domain-containing protein [Asticcacaulis sp.]
MSDPHALSRRTLLGSGLAGLGLTLFPAATRAATQGRKLVVIVLRGGLDGLSMLVPYGDSQYAALRGDIAVPAPGQDNGSLKLDTIFGLHPELGKLHSLALVGQARFAPAVALPEAIRSHFDAQDLLETGGPRLYGQSDGWMNRLAAVLGQPDRTALNVGAQMNTILRGPAPVGSYNVAGNAEASERLISLLMDVYAYDTKLSGLFSQAVAADSFYDTALEGETPARRNQPSDLGRLCATLMVKDGGPDIAALSLDGFDTHANQPGVLPNRLKALNDVLTGLQDGFGPTWSKTLIVAATEFGRTVRVNGTRGTDHGTASCAFIAGGAVKSGGLIGDWPGLGQLFENRDLRPSLDVRSLFKGALRDHLGLEARALAQVFPDSNAAPAVEGLTL